MRFPHLFRPGKIGSLETRNRIIGSPMERNYCTSLGRVTQRYIDYLEARAHSGAGLLYTEVTYVDPRGKGRDLQSAFLRSRVALAVDVAVHRRRTCAGGNGHSFDNRGTTHSRQGATIRFALFATGYDHAAMMCLLEPALRLLAGPAAPGATPRAGVYRLAAALQAVETTA